jgi:hypothetical protein
LHIGISIIATLLVDLRSGNESQGLPAVSTAACLQGREIALDLSEALIQGELAACVHGLCVNVHALCNLKLVLVCTRGIT